MVSADIRANTNLRIALRVTSTDESADVIDAPDSARIAKSTPGLTTLARELDNIVNELAYKPKSGQSYLFYIPWAVHDTNSVLSTQDGVGPLRQGMLMFTCGTLSLLQGFIQNPNQNPTLTTLVQLLDLPSYAQACNGSNPK